MVGYVDIFMIGIFSDVHGNLGALDALLNIFKAQNVETIYFLGDSIGYIPDARVVRRLRQVEHKCYCIRGNHEEFLLNSTICQKNDEIYQLNSIKQALSTEDIDYLNSWPQKREIDLDIGACLFVHGGPNDNLNEYIYPDVELENFNTGHDFIFCGHTHRPFISTSSKTTFVNVGSCGLPRDNGQLGSYCILDTKEQTISVGRFDISEHHRYVESKFHLHDSVKSVFQRTEKVSNINFRIK